MKITSEQNPRFKNLLKLIEKNRERKNQAVIVVEGWQENTFALENNFLPLEFFIQPDIFRQQTSLPLNILTTELDQKLYAKVGYREGTEGIIGLYREPIRELSDEFLAQIPFVLVIESIEKPGNLGAILRSADAFSVKAVVICEEKLDVYNPNVIRSSVGCVFSVSVFSLPKEEVYQRLHHQNFRIVGTHLHETALPIDEIDFSQKTALLFGTEHHGISDFWLDKLDQNTLIPMTGKIDSLNVSNAVAISLYEVARQNKK